MMLSITRNKNWKRALRGTAVAAIWIAAWQILAMAIGREVLLASPVRVACRLWEMAGQGAFWLSIGSSLLRVMAGFVLGVALGILLAAAMHRFTFVCALFSPLVGVIKATPVASFMLLALLWLSVGAVPGFCALVMVLPVICGNVLEGLNQTDVQLKEMTAVFHIKGWRRLCVLTVPSVMPYFMAGAQTCIGLAWKAGIAAEVLCTPRGSLGQKLYESKIYLDTPAMLAWTVVIVTTSILLEKMFVGLVRWIARSSRIGELVKRGKSA